ncbi:MAG: ImmA/IrrE family metallo-endopeptidase [Sphingobacteriaceae bacterium]|nr:MAG: ImmA/IrrE family metallo-endopeptidase [Sphingobacteriaceae bacterium]
MSKPMSNLKLRQVADISYQMVINANITQPPVNVDKITQACGVAIEQINIGEDVSGLLVIHGENAVIAVNPNQGSERKRFTIAHELGHFVLHRDFEKDTVFVDRDFIVKYRSNRIYSEIELKQEQEANAFAASLLMPKEFLFEELNKENMRNLSESALIAELASVFEVSIPAMTFRLTNLNVLY